MATIFMSAVVTDGAAVLFELDEGDGYALPRFQLTDDEDSIEESLVRQLAAHSGIVVRSQEFLETVYERSPGEPGVRLNNLQLVTAWEGTLPELTPAGNRLVLVPVEALNTLRLPEDLRTALAGGLGLDAGDRRDDPAVSVRGRVIIITGPAGAGKSTVAGLLCRSLARAALVGLDVVSHMVQSGRPVPHWEGGDPEQSLLFERLVHRTGAALAANFVSGGFDTVVEGIFEQPADLDLFLSALPACEVYLVTLCPDLDELVRRDDQRPETRRMGDRSLDLHGIFTFNGELRGMRIDATGMDATETSRLILEQLPGARVR